MIINNWIDAYALNASNQNGRHEDESSSSVVCLPRSSRDGWMDDGTNCEAAIGGRNKAITVLARSATSREEDWIAVDGI